MFWSALRRWGERAVAAGVLSLDQIRNGSAEACTALSAAGKPPQTHPAGQEAEDEAEALLDGLLGALLEWPDKEWVALMDRLPDELVDRLYDRMGAR